MFSRPFEIVTSAMLALLTIGMGVMIYLYAEVPKDSGAKPPEQGISKVDKVSNPGISDITRNPELYRNDSYTLTGTVARVTAKQWLLLDNSRNGIALDFSSYSGNPDDWTNKKATVTGTIVVSKDAQDRAILALRVDKIDEAS